MRKKILFFIVVLITFFTTTGVLAKVVTCNYGEYKLVYDTNKYVDIVDHTTPYSYLKVYNEKGNDIQYTFYPEGEPNRSFEIILSTTYFFRIQPKNIGDCPKKLIFQRKDESIQQLELIENNVDNGNNEKDDSNESVNVQNKVNCGNITDIPKKIPVLSSFAITMVQVAVPVILVVMGMIDLFKGITAQKEDEIKKGQQIFIKRLIMGALIFFVVVLVKLLISVIADSSTDNISDCIDCFISNDCN